MALTVGLVLIFALLLSVPIAVALGLAAMAGLFFLSPEFLILGPQKALRFPP